MSFMNRSVKTALLATAAAVGIAVSGAQAQLKHIKMGTGGSNFLDISYYFALLPGPLGYWEQEGYKVDVFPISGSTEAAQQLTVNNLDIAQMSASVIVQANAEHGLPVQAVVTNFTVGWGIAVKKDGDITSVTDLKGKRIGLVSLSSGGIPLLKSYLLANGIDPENDVTLIATGVGAQALSALQNDQVHGLMYWSSALVGFENAGAEIDVLRDEAWAKLPDYSLAANAKSMEDDPKLVESIARGMAKAMVFAAANPDCARQIQWKYYPDTKPTGVSEEKAISSDLAMLNTLLRDQANASGMNEGGNVAGVNQDAMSAYQDFLFDAGVITKKVDPKDLVVDGGPDFWTRINDFDKAAIEAEAKACNI